MDDITQSPFFKDFQREYWFQKETLDIWHMSNSYSDVFNSTPYPQESLYKMLDILEIMDNMYIYSPPSGSGYLQSKSEFYRLIG